MAAPARAAAFRVLREVTAGRGDLGDALTRARDRLPDARDRALATDLALGTLRWRNAIDHQIQQRSAKPLPRLDPAVLDALRLGAYQLLYLERVPVSAVVNDAVDLVKRNGVASAAGFANAVLRRLAREREQLRWPQRDDLVSHLSVVHSHPAWLVERWLARFGADVTEQWLRFNNSPPAITLAANRLRTTRDELRQRLQAEGLDVRETAIAPHGLVVERGAALRSRAFLEGFCVVQDEASQIIPELVQAAPGHRVLDLCASPGGKTIALAAQNTPEGIVIATDVRPRRMRVLTSTLTRCHARHVHTVQIAPTGPLPFRDGTFDRILIDAPCSGLGTVRRDPDIRWRRSPEDLAALADTQVDLLRRAAPLVAPGGCLVYSTCSSEPDENEDVVRRFLTEDESFAVRPLTALDLPADLRRLQTTEGFLRTSPAEALEAFFGAVLCKK
jgi:16S rRNA (cytosine967-C5)-methyltransferase